MQIQSLASQLITPLPASTASTANATTANASTAATDPASTTAAISSTDALGDESTFLQLLVAQIQNQDPTQPMDSSTFLTQLAEFSQVEQLIGIRQDVQELDPSTTGATGTPAAGSTSGS